MVSRKILQKPPLGEEGTAVSKLEYEAVIFDMDGVVTRTASVHAEAWKRTFDSYLKFRSEVSGDSLPEFSSVDYLSHVDGRPRYRGVESFLRSREVELPWGKESDAPGYETVCALGNLKNQIFNEVIENEGISVYDSTLELLAQLKNSDVRVGLATSSRNADLILSKSKLAEMFETVVDGIVSEKLRLKGKPEPDIFLTAAFSLGVDPARSIVVEDAVSGVRAGRSGRFALTVGIAREGNEVALREGGADLVVSDLEHVTPEALNDAVKQRRTRGV